MKHTHKKRKQTLKKTRVYKGGMWGHVIKQALVPLGILAMQQKYKPRKKHTGKFRKSRPLRSRRNTQKK